MDLYLRARAHTHPNTPSHYALFHYGEFEDEEMNAIPGIDDYLNQEEDIEYEYEDDDGDGEGEEITVEELIQLEGIDDEDEDEGEDEGEGEGEDGGEEGRG